MTEYVADEKMQAEEPSAAAPVDEPMHSNMSALGTVQTSALNAAQSALGSVTVEGDASIRASAVGALTADTASVHQSFVGAVMSEGDTSVSQMFTPLVSAQKIDMDSAASCIVVAGEANATKSWIGLMAAREANLSEGSRVLIDWKAALIIGLVLFGGFGLLAAAVFIAARRIMGAVSSAAASLPHLPHLPQMPHMPQMPHLPSMPQMPEWASRLAQLRRSA